MDRRRIGIADIVVGQPLHWDVRDEQGHLLLRRGQVIQSAHQIELLIERGLYVAHADSAHGAVHTTTAAVVPEPESVLRKINIAEKHLEHLLFNMHNEREFPSKVVGIFSELQAAARANSAIAIATVLLNQSSGPYPIRHCIDTALIVIVVSRTLHLSPEELQASACAALTMNVGMLREQAEFQTRPGVLNENERALVQHHPEKSVALLQTAGVVDPTWLDYVLLHHENEDGSGYPTGKSGPLLPRGAKLIALADRYCARISARSYRKAMLPNAALRDFLVGDKKNIDQQLAAAFVHELGIYPVGTFVRLADGEVGVVTGKGETTLTPIVHAVLGPRGAPLAFPIKRDCSKPLHAVRETVGADAAGKMVSMHQLWGNEAKL